MTSAKNCGLFKRVNFTKPCFFDKVHIGTANGGFWLEGNQTIIELSIELIKGNNNYACR